MTILLDSETNGLLDTLDRIHCLCLIRPGEPAVRRYHDQPGMAPRDGSLAMALEELELSDELVAHNLLGFDLPALQKVYPGWRPRGRMRDTLIIGRTVWPEEHLADLDATAIKRGKAFPKNLIGRHALEAWGHRLRDKKGQKPDSWHHLTPEMLDYCAQDVIVLELLWKRIQAHQPSDAQIELEQAFAPLIEAMTKRGFRLDVGRVEALVARLSSRRAELDVELRALFPDFLDEYITPKKKLVKTRVVTFNPNSRQHIARGLTEKHGWKPKAHTPTGLPQIDEVVMAALPYPEARLVHERLTIQKRLGTLAEGDNAWLKLVKPDSRVYGRVTHNAAVTSRCTHSKPNLGNVEASGEMRACWVAGPGNALVIADASGLEARVMGHYAARFDGGDLAQILLEGDVHARNQATIKDRAGLDVARVTAKQVFYGICYGAQDAKVGRILGRSAEIGKRVRDAILAGLPGLGKLVIAVTADAAARGWLRLPDGRRAWVRAEHAALNTLIQGTGSIIMKRALVTAEWAATSMVAFVHDEAVCEVPASLAEVCGADLAAGIVQAGLHYKLRVPLAAHVSIGQDWACK